MTNVDVVYDQATDRYLVKVDGVVVLSTCFPENAAYLAGALAAKAMEQQETEGTR